MTSTPPKAFAPSARLLAAELTDRSERDAAIVDDVALVAYEAKWQKKLAKLQRRYPARWRVPGLSDEEVRDLLTLRLIEAVRGADVAELGQRRAGREWGLLVIQAELRALRRVFKLNVAPADFGEAAVSSRAPNQEEQWLEVEMERGRTLAQAQAERGLSRPQRQWLAALKLSARAGGFFESSAEPNLSAASRVLGKNRSSAQRAYRELQTRFAAELASHGFEVNEAERR
jgi:hypothetical protein